MFWVLTIAGILVGMLTIVLVWGGLHLRQSARQVLADIREVELSDIDALTQECIEVFQRKFGVTLDLDNCDDAIQKLDAAFLNRHSLKQAFQREELYWYFAKPVGACLGELLRRHARHEWRRNPGDSPHMAIALPDGESEVYPFEKVVKQIQIGDTGDLVAYVTFACTLADSAGTSCRNPDRTS